MLFSQRIFNKRMNILLDFNNIIDFMTEVGEYCSSTIQFAIFKGYFDIAKYLTYINYEPLRDVIIDQIFKEDIISNDKIKLLIYYGFVYENFSKNVSHNFLGYDEYLLDFVKLLLSLNYNFNVIPFIVENREAKVSKFIRKHW